MIDDRLERPDSGVAHPAFEGLIGVARTDITPPVGIYARNWGAATHDVAQGIHRPLTATAVSFRTSAEEPATVLVSLDLGWWRSYRDEWFVRHYVLENTGIASNRLMLSFTHTHAGPVLSVADGEKPGGELIEPYLVQLRQNIVEVIKAAQDGEEGCALEWRYGKCGLAKNRDFKDPDAARYLCGYNPKGEADDTLLVGRITTLAGKQSGVIVNYACHPTTLAWDNRLISPDFVGALRDVIEHDAAAGPCLFLQGASGELAPAYQYTDDVRIADAHGRELGYAVLSTLSGMNLPGKALHFNGAIESGAPLAKWNQVPSSAPTELNCHQIDVEFPLQEMPSIAAIDALLRSCTDRVTVERLNRKRLIREALGQRSSTHVPVWIWQIGGAFFIGHPNEAYSELQSEIRAKFPNHAICVMNVVNGHFGYLPPRNLYSEDIYPVWQTPFGAGSLEHLVETCIHRLETLAI